MLLFLYLRTNSCSAVKNLVHIPSQLYLWQRAYSCLTVRYIIQSIMPNFVFQQRYRPRRTQLYQVKAGLYSNHVQNRTHGQLAR